MTSRVTRPDTAPRGAVRAHLATFPPRAGILRRVIDAALPQVDHLYLALNGYDAVPDDLAAEPRITAVIPDRDLRDAGKFLFPPDADDIVFQIDDDLAYPADYVARSIAAADAIGWEGAVFGYMANAWTDAGWRFTRLRAPVDEAEPAVILGTCTTLARGDMVAPLDAIEPFHGHVDIAYAHWVKRRGGQVWMLPRPSDWLSTALPPDLVAGSLYVTDAPNPPPHVTRLIDDLIRAATLDAHRQAAARPRAAAAKEA